MSLAGKHVLVAGATGEVGQGVVEQLLAAGCRVTAVTRSAERGAALVQRLGAPAGLTMAIGELTSPDESEELTASLQSDAPLDAVVAALGGWHQGPALRDTPWADWYRVMDSGLNAHFAAARSFMPLLARTASGVYVMINGAAALEPVAGAGPVCVSAAAQLMLTKVLALEARPTGITVFSLLLETPIVTRTRPPPHRDDWLRAVDVGRHVVAMIETPTRFTSTVERLRHRGQTQLH